MKFEFEEPWWTISALVAILLTGLVSTIASSMGALTWGIAAGWIAGLGGWAGMYIFSKRWR